MFAFFLLHPSRLPGMCVATVGQVTCMYGPGGVGGQMAGRGKW